MAAIVKYRRARALRQTCGSCGSHERTRARATTYVLRGYASTHRVPPTHPLSSLSETDGARDVRTKDGTRVRAGVRDRGERGREREERQNWPPVPARIHFIPAGRAGEERTGGGKESRLEIIGRYTRIRARGTRGRTYRDLCARARARTLSRREEKPTRGGRT